MIPCAEYVPEDRILRWIVAAPGADVAWVCIVSEDEDGVRSGWGIETVSRPVAAARPRRRV